MIVVEVGIKLDKDYKYYDDMLINHGLKKVKAVLTKDVYYTNKDLNGMSENEMKNACVRFRTYNITERNGVKEDSELSVIQNYSIFDSNVDKIECEKKYFNKYEDKLVNAGWKKMFDLDKTDYQYKNNDMKSMIQLQYTSGLGLIVYYDNPDYYEYDLEEQRRKLIDELNSYGFEFNYDTLGIDRLRSIYYKREMFSANQNA